MSSLDVVDFIADTARDVSKNKRVQDVVTSAGPGLIGTAVVVTTANPVAAGMATTAANTWAKTNSESFTEVAVGFGLCALAPFVSLIGIPILLGAMAYEGLKRLADKK